MNTKNTNRVRLKWPRLNHEKGVQWAMLVLFILPIRRRQRKCFFTSLFWVFVEENQPDGSVRKERTEPNQDLEKNVEERTTKKR